MLPIPVDVSQDVRRQQQGEPHTGHGNVAERQADGLPAQQSEICAGLSVDRGAPAIMVATLNAPRAMYGARDKNGSRHNADGAKRAMESSALLSAAETWCSKPA